MRTLQQMRVEIEVRRALGMPRIELTEQERIEAFGEINLADHDALSNALIARFQQDLPLSIQDKRKARKLLKARAI